MRFLLRMAFWLGVILVLLPSFASSEKSESSANAPQISASEAVSAASSTVGDIGRFCSRQPDACAVGAEAAAVLSEKAQAGAKIIYKYLNDKRATQNTGSVTDAKSANAPAAPRSKSSLDTLTPHDLSPAWRGPQSATEAQANRPASL